MMLRSKIRCADSGRPTVKAVTKTVTPVFLMIFACSVSSHAFEVDGFRSGMSPKEALPIARDFSKDAHALKHDEERTTVFFGVKVAEDKIRTWQLFFCNDRLVELHKSTPFSWPQAAERVSGMNEHYGEGSVNPMNYVRDLSKIPSLETKSKTTLTGLDLVWENEVEGVSLFTGSIRTDDPEPWDAPEGWTQEVIMEFHSLKEGVCFDE